MPKGEKLIGQSKRTTTPPCFLKLFFQNCICKKPSWQLRGELFQGGGFYLAKRKAFEKGENLSNFENAFRNFIFLYHWLIAKEFEKTFPKYLQKQAKWCKCGPKY
jgi:hypothetical protein